MVEDKMVKFEKNKFNFEKTFDFNELAKLVDSGIRNTRIATPNVNTDFILESPIKIDDVESYPCFKNIYQYLNQELNSNNKKSNICLFFSFTSGGKGMAHVDEEDVAIIGLYGTTIYIIEDQYYFVKKGDMLYIPNGVVHRAIGLSPRIIMSFGVYG